MRGYVRCRSLEGLLCGIMAEVGWSVVSMVAGCRTQNWFWLIANGWDGFRAQLYVLCVFWHSAADASLERRMFQHQRWYALSQVVAER